MTSLEEARRRLAQRYRESLRREREALAAALKVLDEAAIEDVRQRAHRLRGSGASYGFPDITDAAEALELADRGDFEPCLRVLLSALEQHAAD